MTRRREPAFCFGIAGIAKAPWRPNVSEAKEDAIDAGFASRDESTGTIYVTVPGEIYESYELHPVIPRAMWTLPQPVSADPSSLTRIERIIARREAGMKKAG